MANLHRLNLVDYLHQASQQQRGIIGICLGMQLLTERSCELELTSGLGLIPGETIAHAKPMAHWLEQFGNSIRASAADAL